VRQRAQHHSKIDLHHIDVITVDHGKLKKGKWYTVDHGRKALVEAAVGKSLGFSFGATADLRAR
jgi:hypothetical protein